MNRKKWISILLLICICATSVLMGSCDKKSGKILSGNSQVVLDEDEYFIYYLDKDNTSLQYKILECDDVNDSTEMAKLFMDEMSDLMRKNISEGSVISKLNSIEVNKSIVTLDFDKDFSKNEILTGILYRACIVLTLTQIKGVEYVKITEVGQTIIDENGNALNMLKAADYANFKDGFPYTQKEVELVLYYANTDNTMLKKKNEKCVYDYTVSYEEFVINKLIEGVTENDVENGYKTTLPKGTVIDFVYTKDGVCYVDFDESIMNKVRTTSTELILYSIINSLTEQAYVSKVQFSVEGESNIKLYNEFDLSEPFTRNVDLIIKESGENQ